MCLARAFAVEKTESYYPDFTSGDTFLDGSEELFFEYYNCVMEREKIRMESNSSIVLQVAKDFFDDIDLSADYGTDGNTCYTEYSAC